MMNLDVMKSPDRGILFPGFRVRSAAEELAGPIDRHVWSDWCRSINQKCNRCSWVELETAAILMARAYVASKGVRSYRGEFFAAAVHEARKYWQLQAGEEL